MDGFFLKKYEDLIYDTKMSRFRTGKCFTTKPIGPFTRIVKVEVIFKTVKSYFLTY